MSLRNRVDRLEKELEPADGMILRVLEPGEDPGPGPHYEVTANGRRIPVLYLSSEDARL